MPPPMLNEWSMTNVKRAGERLGLLRHDVRVVAGQLDATEQFALFVVFDINQRTVLAAFEKGGVTCKIQFALQLAGMMAAGATALEDRDDVLVIAHGLGVIGGGER